MTAVIDSFSLKEEGGALVVFEGYKIPKYVSEQDFKKMKAIEV